MTTILAIKDDRGLHIGVQGSEECVVEFERDGIYCVGLAGSGALAQSISNRFRIPVNESELQPEDYLITLFVPVLWDFLMTHNPLVRAEMVPDLDLILTLQGRVFLLKGGNVVIPFAEYARGLIDGINDDDAEAAIETALMYLEGYPFAGRRIRKICLLDESRGCHSRGIE